MVNGTPKDSTHFKGLVCQAIANSGGVVDYVDIVEQRTLKRWSDRFEGRYPPCFRR